MNRLTKRTLLFISLFLVCNVSYISCAQKGRPGAVSIMVKKLIAALAEKPVQKPLYITEHQAYRIRALIIKIYKDSRKRTLSQTYQEDKKYNINLSKLAREALTLPISATKTITDIDKDPKLLRPAGLKIVKLAKPARALHLIKQWLRGGFSLESELYDVTGRGKTKLTKRTPNLQDKSIKLENIRFDSDPRTLKGRAEKLLWMAYQLKLKKPFTNHGRPKYFSNYLTACDNIRSKIKKSIRSVAKRLLTGGTIKRISVIDARAATRKFLALLYLLNKKLTGFNVDGMPPAFDLTGLRRKNIKRKIKRVQKQVKKYNVNVKAATPAEAIKTAMYPRVELYAIDKEKDLLKRIQSFQNFMQRVSPQYLKAQKNSTRKKITKFTDKKLGIASKNLKRIRKDPAIRKEYLNLLAIALKNPIYAKPKTTNHKKLVRSLYRAFENYLDAHKEFHRNYLVMQKAVGELKKKRRSNQGKFNILEQKQIDKGGKLGFFDGRKYNKLKKWLDEYSEKIRIINSLRRGLPQLKKEIETDPTIQSAPPNLKALLAKKFAKRNKGKTAIKVKLKVKKIIGIKGVPFTGWSLKKFKKLRREINQTATKVGIQARITVSQ